MGDDELTRGELLDKVEALRRRVSELERAEVERKQAEKERVSGLEAERKKLEEELELRFAQLKASEEELKQTRRQLRELEAHAGDNEKKLAETERYLKESEEHYRQLVYHLPGMLAIQDVAEKKYVFWNRDLGWSGYTLDEWNSLSHDKKRKLIHPDDLPRYLKAWKGWEASDFRHPLKIDYRIRHKDGHYRWIEAYFFKERAEDDTILAQLEISWDITSLKEADARVRESEARFRLIAENQRELIYKQDAEGKFAFVSPSYCETFGRKPSDLLGKRFTPPVHQDDIEATNKAMEGLKVEPYSCHLEHRTLTKDGWKWFGWDMRVERDSKGKATGVLAVGRDISALKRMSEELDLLREQVAERVAARTEELSEANARLIKQLEEHKAAEADIKETRANLQMLLKTFKDLVFVLDKSGNPKNIKPEILESLGKSEAELLGTLKSLEDAGDSQRRTVNNLRMMADSVEDFLFVMDSKGRILFTNATVASRLEYPEEALLGMNILELHPPNRRDEASAVLSEVIAGKTRSHEIPLLAKDRTLIPVETRLALGRWDNKNVIIASSRDSTERKLAERRLEESERRFRLIAEEASVGMCIMQDDVVRYANPSIKDILGYSREEVMNWTGQEFENIVHQEDRENFLRQRRRARSSGNDDLTRFTFRALTRDGGTKLVDLYSKPITYDNSYAELLTIIDRTEFKRADEDRTTEIIRNVRYKKEEALELLAGAMAHDFNELLTIITGHSQMGMMALHENDPVRIDLEEISKAAESGSQLTWKLLTFAGRLNLDLRTVELGGVVENLRGVVERVLGKQMTLDITTAKELGKVRVDREQLEQVIINLAINARDAMPNGGRVELKTYRESVPAGSPLLKENIKPGDYQVISFRDSGKGMSAEDLDRIFDPFYTTKLDKKGGGLSLAVCRGIIRKSGGHILAESRPGEGTTFRIYLPEVKTGEEAPPEGKPESDTLGSGQNVLVVDDDDAVRDMAAQILRWHGYRVLSASSGAEAFEMCQKMERQVDIVVSDVYMPNMSGLELVERLRKLWKSVKVLFISGATSDKSPDPEAPLLRKPFPPLDLVRRVHEMLEG